MSRKDFKFFSVLPKAINVESSSSDDEVPEMTPSRRPNMKFASQKPVSPSNHLEYKENDEQKSDESMQKHTETSIDSSSFDLSNRNSSNLKYSSHSQLMSQNFSTFSPEKVRNLPETTIESLQQDSMRLLVNETTDKNNILTNQRNQLALELKQLKRENSKKLEELRNRLEKMAFQLEKSTATYRSQKKEIEKALQAKLDERDLNDRFISLNEKEKHINDTIQSFTDCSETITNLSKVLIYDVLTENDFEILESTSSLDSPIGKCVSNFMAAAKSVIVEKQKD